MLRVTAKQQLMREIVDLLSVLTEEAKLSWGENGLSTTVVDGSHVALLSVTVADACFETYEVEPVEIGLELGKLRDLLTLAGPNDLVELDYDGATGAIMSVSAKFIGFSVDLTRVQSTSPVNLTWTLNAKQP